MKLLEHYGFEIGESTIQRITLGHAQAIFESDRAGWIFRGSRVSINRSSPRSTGA
jgi:hypothetical protein